MGMKKGERVKKWIDLAKLPKNKNGKSIRWLSTVGITMDFVYGDYSGTLTITDVISDGKYKVLIFTNEEYKQLAPQFNQTIQN